ncbi:MAG: hypothetical protein MK100_00355 [Phycisphaerales bacterium]|nr:hypothetical protein [Phycisphaerales bacterium]
MSPWTSLTALLAASLATIGVMADTAPKTTTDISASHSSIAAGVPFDIVCTLEMPPGWHTYWMDPGASGTEADIVIDAPTGFKVGPVRYPRPHTLKEPSGTVNALDGKVTIALEIRPPRILHAESVSFPVDIVWLVCQKACFPVHAAQTLTLPVTASPGRLTAAGTAAASLPASLAKRPNTRVEITRTAVIIEGAADPNTQAGFLPAAWPGVTWGSPRMSKTAQSFSLYIPFAYDPTNGLGRPPRLRGLLTLGRSPRDPSWVLDRPVDIELGQTTSENTP